MTTRNALRDASYKFVELNYVYARSAGGGTVEYQMTYLP
jgi:hypothetical protein